MPQFRLKNKNPDKSRKKNSQLKGSDKIMIHEKPHYSQNLRGKSEIIETNESICSKRRKNSLQSEIDLIEQLKLLYVSKKSKDEEL